MHVCQGAPAGTLKEHLGQQSSLGNAVIPVAALRAGFQSVNLTSPEFHSTQAAAQGGTIGNVPGNGMGELLAPVALVWQRLLLFVWVATCDGQHAGLDWIQRHW